MVVSFKKWLEVMSQGGIVDKEQPEKHVTALSVHSHDSDERPITKSNKIKKLPKKKRNIF